MLATYIEKSGNKNVWMRDYIGADCNKFSNK